MLRESLVRLLRRASGRPGCPAVIRKAVRRLSRASPDLVNPDLVSPEWEFPPDTLTTGHNRLERIAARSGA